MYWSKDCLEEFPESLVFDQIRNTEDEMWNGIDVTEAGDKAEDFNTYQNYSLNGNIMTEVTLDNQKCREPSINGLELWFSSQDFRTEFDKVEFATVISEQKLCSVLRFSRKEKVSEHSLTQIKSQIMNAL